MDLVAGLEDLMAPTDRGLVANLRAAEPDLARREAQDALDAESFSAALANPDA